MVKLTILAITALISTSFGFVIDPKLDTSADNRIVGGSDATEGQFPYQVSIRKTANGDHDCGGSIINSKWILTAAHCVINSSPSDWFIFAGSVSLSGNGVSRQLSQIIIHPDYSLSWVHSDIAVLELEEELQFSANIQPIQLEIEDVGAVDCVVSGWGLLSTDGVIPDIMQFVALRTLTAGQCLEFWDWIFTADLEVCTLTQVGEGVCAADSGGPLVANGRQIGIVSWASSMCGSGYPDVYVKVSAFIDWIDNSIN